jgi:signal transduction histidine kinase/CheY-like chemotaxis protein
MPAPPQQRSVCVAAARLAALITAGVAGASLIGWAVDLERFFPAFPGGLLLKANGALALGLCAISLLGRIVPRRPLVARLASGLVVIACSIASLTLLEYWGDLDLRIDEVLVRDARGAPHPGRMSPATALCTVLVGVAILLLDFRTQAHLRPAEILGALTGTFGFVSLVGYLYEAESLYRLSSRVTPMAVQTAVLLLLMGSALMLARPDGGLVGFLRRDELGSAVGRALLPVLTLLALLFGWLRLYGEDAGWFDRAVGTALFTVANAVVVGVVMMVAAQRLNRASGRLAQERREQALRLAHSQRMESLGTLAGGIAHDFNNLLTASSGYLELARRRLPPDHPAMSCLNEVARANERAEQLVGQVLAFGRPHAGSRQAVLLETVVKEVAQLMRASVPAMVDILTEFSEPEIYVHVDPSQIHQAILNLAVNGIQAMGGQERGELRLQVDIAVRSSGDEEIAAGKYARLRVTDTGCGMDRAVLDRVFEPFFTTRRQGSGTGLGLSTVLGIVKANGGTITVTSAEGQGSTFAVWLPLSERSAEDAATSGAVGEVSRGHGERVLYVDDEQAIVKLAAETLGALNYTVVGCSDPHLARAAFDRDPEGFSLVVTDLAMPNMSGIRLARHVHERRPELPIILVSGNLSPGRREEAHAAGVCAVVEKPGMLRQLPAVMGQVLDPGRR